MLNPFDNKFLYKFDNFKKAYNVFRRRLTEYKKNFNNEAYQMALIQAFEIITELSWKLLKAYLEDQGIYPKTPKETIRYAYTNEIIKSPDIWFDVLKRRNLTSHIYREEVLKETLIFIAEKFDIVVQELYNYFIKLLEE